VANQRSFGNHTGENHSAQVNAALGATPAAPDPSLGDIFDYKLTASTTIPFPVVAGAWAAPSAAGDTIRFILRQSGAGTFGVTWASGYKAVGFTPTAGTTAVDVVEFVFDGTIWNLCSSYKGSTA
jgi:hypothetical protein